MNLVFVFAFVLCSIVHCVPLVENPKSGATETVEENLLATAAAKNVDDNPLEKDNEVVATSLIENPTYDPNLYSSLISQDSVQQYMNQFAPGFAPFGAAIGYAPAPAYPGPFAVQTGYEGFLVPELRPAVASSSDTFSLLRSVLPRALISWVLKSSAMILSAISVVFFGGAITTVICSLTPLCSISFKGLPFMKWKETAESIGKVIGTEITPERVRRTAELVQTAVEKYTELQNVVHSKSRNN